MPQPTATQGQALHVSNAPTAAPVADGAALEVPVPSHTARVPDGDVLSPATRRRDGRAHHGHFTRKSNEMQLNLLEVAPPEIAEEAFVPEDLSHLTKAELALRARLKEATISFQLLADGWGWLGSDVPLRTVEMQGDASPTVKICNFDSATLMSLKRTWRRLKNGGLGVSMAQMEYFIDQKVSLGPLRDGMYGLVLQNGDVALGFKVSARRRSVTHTVTLTRLT